MIPTTVPMRGPLSVGGMILLNSSFVRPGPLSLEMALSRALFFLSRTAAKTSENANRPITRGTKSKPFLSLSDPNVYLAIPNEGSEPMVARNRWR